jgi:hypothetical protein
MELHDLAECRLPRTRRVSCLAFLKTGGSEMLRMMNRPAGAGHAH